MTAPTMKKRSLVIPEVDAGEKFPVPLAGDFYIEDKEQEFLSSVELTRLGNALIDNRGCFSDLKKATVIFLFKKEGGKSKGKNTIGRCIKPTGMLSYYTQADFLIWVAADHTEGVNYWTMEAVLFHELKHADLDFDDEGEKKLSLNPHDWEGFIDEIRFYGTWRSEIEKLKEVFQPTLFDSLK